MNFNLDNALSYNKADLMDMNSRLESYPKLLSEGWQESKAIDLPPSYSRISKILIHGMGGSAIGGDASAASKLSKMIDKATDINETDNDK